MLHSPYVAFPPLMYKQVIKQRGPIPAGQATSTGIFLILCRNLSAHAGRVVLRKHRILLVTTTELLPFSQRRPSLTIDFMLWRLDDWLSRVWALARLRVIVILLKSIIHTRGTKKKIEQHS